MNKIKMGDIFDINSGGSVTVLEYVNASCVKIKHNDEHGHVTTVEAAQLRKGQVKNPYAPSVLGVGHLGCGKYKAKPSGQWSSNYITWKSMLTRCYYKKEHARRPNYEDCSVCDEWLNFQIFSDWYYKQPNSQKNGFHLDKDLLVLDNKIYSPDTCSFVPAEINTLLNGRDNSRGNLPQGVSYSKNGKSYEAAVRVKNKSIYLGTYSSIEDAYNVYRKEKARQVRIIAKQYREYLHPKVYGNLMWWEL